MAFIIPREIVGQARRCDFDHCCLDAEGTCRCRIVESPGDEAVCVAGNRPTLCGYRKAFSDCHICTCPVRVAIYRRYGL